MVLNVSWRLEVSRFVGWLVRAGQERCCKDVILGFWFPSPWCDLEILKWWHWWEFNIRISFANMVLKNGQITTWMAKWMSTIIYGISNYLRINRKMTIKWQLFTNQRFSLNRKIKEIILHTRDWRFWWKHKNKKR